MTRISIFAFAVLGLTACTDDADPPGELAVTAQAALSCGAPVAIAGVTASGAQDGNPASHAVDGDLATRWSQQGVGAAITADLGAARAVCGVDLAWYQGDQRTSQFTVSTSTDNVSFTQVAAATSSGTTTALEPTTFAPRTARYVRVTFQGNSVNDWSSIDELKVRSAGFVHPGVLVGTSQLATVKAKIAAGATPWKTSYNELAGNKYVRSGWTASPRATIECGSFNMPDNGCTQEYDDANAAYSNALMYAYTGTAAYADVAVAILNAYARTVTAHTNSNAPLEAGWAAERFIRAAEIVRYTSTRWAAADVTAFAAFMRSVYLPLVQNGWLYGNGNWDLTMLDATVSIAVFTDDRATFDAAIAKWKLRVPAYIYLHTDGTLPVRPSGTTSYDSAGSILALWIAGRGTIDGRGTQLRQAHDAVPNLIRVRGGQRIAIRDVLLRDAAAWTVHLLGARHVEVTNVKIVNHRGTLNTDGIDPDSCQDVLIRGCLIHTKDDAICVKATNNSDRLQDVERISVIGNVVSSLDAGLKVGTESQAARFADLEFRDNDVFDAGRALSVVVRDGARYERIAFRDVRVGPGVRHLIEQVIGVREGRAPTLGRVDGLVLEDVVAPGFAPPDSHRTWYTQFRPGDAGAAEVPVFAGADAEHAVRGLVLRRVVIAGEPVRDRQTAARAGLTIGPHVDDVTIE